MFGLAHERGDSWFEWNGAMLCFEGLFVMLNTSVMIALAWKYEPVGMGFLPEYYVQNLTEIIRDE